MPQVTVWIFAGCAMSAMGTLTASGSVAAQSNYPEKPIRFVVGASTPETLARMIAPVSLIVDSVNILAVHPSVPAKSVKELVALAKAQPGMLTYGSGGSGTSQHLGGELLKTMARVDMVHVPYKVGTAAVPDLLSGASPCSSATSRRCCRGCVRASCGGLP